MIKEIIYDGCKDESDILMVVDGQQRITSTIIIFAAIRKILKTNIIVLKILT